MAKDVSMEPSDEVGADTVAIPITFNYKGGRKDGTRTKTIGGVILFLITFILLAMVWKNEGNSLLAHMVYSVILVWISTMILRYGLLREHYYRPIYNKMLSADYKLNTNSIWQIFDIEEEYPYVCYFKGGYKGIFVRMTRDLITGKGENAEYNHFNAIGNAYKKAASLGLDFTHVDYMDDIGDDERLKKLVYNLQDIKNPQMQSMMAHIYKNLEEEMSCSYASYDLYVFKTKDKSSDLFQDVQSVLGVMLGGDFVTYKVLDREALGKACAALFNLHEFSVNKACTQAISNKTHAGIVPLTVKTYSGEVQKLGLTQAEKRKKAAEELAKLEAAKGQKSKTKKIKAKPGKKKKKSVQKENKFFEQTGTEGILEKDEDMESKGYQLPKPCDIITESEALSRTAKEVNSKEEDSDGSEFDLFDGL